MMKIAYVCADLGVPVFGQKGCSIHVQEVVRAFLQHGAEVTLITPRLGGEPPPGLEQASLIRLPSSTSTDPRQREVHAQHLNEHIVAALAQAGPFDMVYERYSLWSFAAMEYANGQALPGILEVNAPLIEEQARHRQLIHRADAEQTARRVFAAASALVAVSTEVADYLSSYHQTCGRIHVIGNGVNPTRFQYAATPPPKRPFTIGFVGTLKPWHGLDDLIEAFVQLHRDHADSRLLIVGDGPKRPQLEAALKAHGLADAAGFTGSVAPERVPQLLAAMDVAVAPYPDNQDFYFSPLKVLEYMATGLPVVASRIGQLDGLIEDGRNGILCPPGQPTALARALAHLIANPALRRTLGNAARRTVEQAHSWQTVTQRILKLAGMTVPQPRPHVANSLKASS